jgi:hypothetical protein
LAWLQFQAESKTKLGPSDLAKRWGWSRHQVSRRIATWMKGGLVRKDKAGALVAAQGAERRTQDAAHTEHVVRAVPPEQMPALAPAQEAAHSPAHCAAQASVVAEEKPRA